jgi:hypothetical protein
LNTSVCTCIYERPDGGQEQKATICHFIVCILLILLLQGVSVGTWFHQNNFNPDYTLYTLRSQNWTIIEFYHKFYTFWMPPLQGVGFL